MDRNPPAVRRSRQLRGESSFCGDLLPALVNRELQNRYDPEITEKLVRPFLRGLGALC